jgi:hypothetical protein
MTKHPIMVSSFDFSQAMTTNSASRFALHGANRARAARSPFLQPLQRRLSYQKSPPGRAGTSHRERNAVNLVRLDGPCRCEARL